MKNNWENEEESKKVGRLIGLIVISEFHMHLLQDYVGFVRISWA